LDLLSYKFSIKRDNQLSCPSLGNINGSRYAIDALVPGTEKRSDSTITLHMLP
jgi:hypothetical protein